MKVYWLVILRLVLVVKVAYLEKRKCCRKPKSSMLSSRCEGGTKNNKREIERGATQELYEEAS